MLPFSRSLSRYAPQRSRLLLGVSSPSATHLPTTIQAAQTANSQSLQGQQQQNRWKHSERQVKRFFRKHPATIRVEKRMGIDRTPEPMAPPEFEAVFEPHFLPNGWSAPPGPEVAIPEYPFQVKRTKNKPHEAVGFLPVYSEFR